MSVLAIIPARGGSKGVPGKNIHLLDGHTLIAYAIAAGRNANGIDRLVVSTDSPEIAKIASRYGAETPFLRPAELSGDRATDAGYILHALDWFRDHENWVPDFVMQLRPTTPLREPELVSKAVCELGGDADATSLRSAHALPEPPQKMFQIVNGRFEGFFPNDSRPEYYNLPRQTFPKAYHPNGYVEIVRTRFSRETGLLYGDRILPWVTPLAIEVDNLEDFAFLEWQIQRRGNPLRALLGAAC